MATSKLLRTFSLTEILLGNARQIGKKIQVDFIDVVDEGNGNGSGRGKDVGETELFPLGLTSPLPKTPG